MINVAVLGPEKESLAEFTNGERKAPVIKWYRTKLSKEDMLSVHARSDAKAALQTLGFLAVLAVTFSAALYSYFHWAWYTTCGFVFLHGMMAAFIPNGVHELGHGTVFRTKWLNVFFCHLFSFLGIMNLEIFQNGHTRHHRFTLHPPEDLEVVLPQRETILKYLRLNFVNIPGIFERFTETLRIARGGFRGEWEMTLYPAAEPETRVAPVRWARILLVGHAILVAVSLYFGLWIIPVLITLAPFYGSWLFFLCNGTQHIGLQDNVPDFRLCCRTFTLNPVLQFLYWHMNYHTEHHMYAAVPCYNLGKLHRAIKHDLPPCAHGLVAVWTEIADIQKKQQLDPTYQYNPTLPNPVQATPA